MCTLTFFYISQSIESKDKSNDELMIVLFTTVDNGTLSKKLCLLLLYMPAFIIPQ